MSPIDANEGHGGVGERVASGQHADVWLFGEALEEFKKLKERNDETSIREARTLERYFARFAELGMMSLSDKMYKPQGRWKDASGNEHLIYEFKAYQFRVYGTVRSRNGKRSFLGTACEPSKKKDKANSQTLKRAAEKSKGIYDD